MQKLLDHFQGKKWFFSIDLFSGYYQIPLEEKSQEKTAMWTKYGLFQYTVMPFELSNAPATFQRVMEAVLALVLYKKAVVYIGDVIVFSESLEVYFKDVSEVMGLIKEANLKVNKKNATCLKKILVFWVCK